MNKENVMRSFYLAQITDLMERANIVLLNLIYRLLVKELEGK